MPVRGRHKPPPTYRFGSWSLQADSGRIQPIDAVDQMDRCIADVLRQLQSNWSVFVALGTQYDAALVCVVEAYGSPTPALVVEQGALKQLAELNTFIDIDLYCHTDETDE